MTQFLDSDQAHGKGYAGLENSSCSEGPLPDLLYVGNRHCLGKQLDILLDLQNYCRRSFSTRGPAPLGWEGALPEGGHKLHITYWLIMVYNLCQSSITFSSMGENSTPVWLYNYSYSILRWCKRSEKEHILQFLYGTKSGRAYTVLVEKCSYLGYRWVLK